jgi:GntR family transcriptional repressor for pyruvate dehydrogenase complex
MTDTAVGKFQAVSPKSLTQGIADQVERLILSHELQIGDALPAERELAAQLQVSRNILREAIKMLAQKGLLEIRPGSGTFVVRPSTEFLQDSLDFFIRFNSSALFDLVEARLSLEVEIAGLAAQRANAEDYQRIKFYLDQMEEKIDDYAAYIEADLCFHEALAQAAKNEILQLLLSSIRGALRKNIGHLAKHHPSAVATAMQYHHHIARAIQQRDEQEARLAMRGHVEEVGRGLRDLEAQGITFEEG